MSKTHYFGGVFVIKNLNHGNIFLQSSFINVCAVNQGDNLDITRSCTKVQAGKDIRENPVFFISALRNDRDCIIKTAVLGP